MPDLMEAAGFGEVVVTAETIATGETTAESAWQGNVGSAVFAEVRTLPLADLERMRQAYLSTITPDDLAPYDVLFIVARVRPG